MSRPIRDEASCLHCDWLDKLYSDPIAYIRRSDLPAAYRDSLWRALIRGYGCEVRP